MALQEVRMDVTFVLGEDLTGKYNVPVKLDTNGYVVAAGAGEGVIGVLKEGFATGIAGVVAIYGKVQVTAGETLTPGVAVEMAAANKVVTLAAGVKVGTTLTGGANGEEIQILLFR